MKLPKELRLTIFELASGPGSPATLPFFSHVSDIPMHIWVQNADIMNLLLTSKDVYHEVKSVLRLPPGTKPNLEPGFQSELQTQDVYYFPITSRDAKELYLSLIQYGMGKNENYARCNIAFEVVAFRVWGERTQGLSMWSVGRHTLEFAED